MNAYYNPERTSTSQRANGINSVTYGLGFINFLCAIVAFFTSTAAIKVEKICFSAICFVAFFGTVGSMESGNIGMLLGITICALATLLEFATLKSLVKRK